MNPWWLLLIWPLTGWIGGVCVWTRTWDLQLAEAVLFGVFGAFLGPILVGVLALAMHEPQEPMRRSPIVLIRARRR